MFIGLVLSSNELLILLIGGNKLALFTGSFSLDIFTSCGDYKEFFWFNDVLWINRVLKVFFLDIFVLVFAYELLTLLNFVIFQNKLRLEELDVYKSRFHRQERKLENCCKCYYRFILTSVIVLLLAFIVIRFDVFFNT